MNIYRGCTHGCIYCDSRSTCYQMKHDFQDIQVKENAPQLLLRTLMGKRRRFVIGTGAMCDPYMHCEESLRLTRRCLKVIADLGFGAAIQTKSDRILQDLPLLEQINRKAKCVVQITLTTYDEPLCAILEPNVCGTHRRYETLLQLRDAGIPTVVWLSPILPYINDTPENIRGILDLCADAGVKGVVCFGMGVTLRDGDRDYFFRALDRHFPGMKERYIRRFGNAYECPSDSAGPLMQLFHETCEKAGMMHDNQQIFNWIGELPHADEGEQLSLF